MVGEGFYGDEKDEQLDILDPDSTGVITRKAFVSWYVNFVSAADGDDDDSLDTADREERAEERQNADQAFTDTAGEGVDVIDVVVFGDLIEAMGTTYCEEEHRRTIKKISGADGKITRAAFIAWYLDWLFGGDESDIETDEEDEADEADEEVAPAASSGEGWGSAFGVEEGSWKCDARRPLRFLLLRRLLLPVARSRGRHPRRPRLLEVALEQRRPSRAIPSQPRSLLPVLHFRRCPRMHKLPSLRQL